MVTQQSHLSWQSTFVRLFGETSEHHTRERAVYRGLSVEETKVELEENVV